MERPTRSWLATRVVGATAVLAAASLAGTAGVFTAVSASDSATTTTTTTTETTGSSDELAASTSETTTSSDSETDADSGSS